MNTFNEDLAAYVEQKKRSLVREWYEDMKLLIKNLTIEAKSRCEANEKSEADDLLTNI